MINIIDNIKVFLADKLKIPHAHISNAEQSVSSGKVNPDHIKKLPYMNIVLHAQNQNYDNVLLDTTLQVISDVSMEKMLYTLFILKKELVQFKDEEHDITYNCVLKCCMPVVQYKDGMYQTTMKMIAECMMIRHNLSAAVLNGNEKQIGEAL